MQFVKSRLGAFVPALVLLGSFAGAHASAGEAKPAKLVKIGSLKPTFYWVAVEPNDNEEKTKELKDMDGNVLARVSASLNHEGRAPALRSLGRRMQPAAATGSCGDGCGSCNSCGPTVAPTEAQPLHFKPRRPS